MLTWQAGDDDVADGGDDDVACATSASLSYVLCHRLGPHAEVELQIGLVLVGGGEHPCILIENKRGIE